MLETKVRCKNSKCSDLMSHLCSPQGAWGLLTETLEILPQKAGIDVWNMLLTALTYTLFWILLCVSLSQPLSHLGATLLFLSVSWLKSCAIFQVCFRWSDLQSQRTFQLTHKNDEGTPSVSSTVISSWWSVPAPLYVTFKKHKFLNSPLPWNHLNLFLYFSASHL